MPSVLINDGIHPSGLKKLQDHGFEVETNKIQQEDLESKLPSFDAICVRSATKVRAALIDACPNLRLIGRGGVGLDNIDVEYAKSKNIAVVNTPAASSRSVAELVFAHLLGIARFVYKSNRHMPQNGQDEFKALKKSYSKGFELKGKTLGVIGLGRIGEETAKIGLVMGMDVLGVDPFIETKSVTLDIGSQQIQQDIPMVGMDEMLGKADVISLHVPFLGSPVLSTEEFDKMKDGVILINASRGGVVDEDALLQALNQDKVTACGVDVFENEPMPRADLLKHPNISCTPHIGASTGEAQERIGLELADKIIAHFS
ncbi:MAG: D-2-hydroxyacid dehydrogenase [Bacteroidia bacterium]|nr:D-2-hydroxyacid dehydrogenase [Bacteroidia bacterium]